MQNHPAFKVNNSKKTPPSKIIIITTIFCFTHLFTSLLLLYYGHYFSAVSVTRINSSFFQCLIFRQSKCNFQNTIYLTVICYKFWSFWPSSGRFYILSNNRSYCMYNVPCNLLCYMYIITVKFLITLFLHNSLI